MAVVKAFAQDAVDRAEPLTVDAAYAQCRAAALAESAIGAVGLRLSHIWSTSTTPLTPFPGSALRRSRPWSGRSRRAAR